MDLHLPDAMARAIHCAAPAAADGAAWAASPGEPQDPFRVGGVGAAPAGRPGRAPPPLPFCRSSPGPTQEERGTGASGLAQRHTLAGWHHELEDPMARCPAASAPYYTRLFHVLFKCPRRVRDFPPDPLGNSFFTLSLWSSARAYASFSSPACTFRLARTRCG